MASKTCTGSCLLIPSGRYSFARHGYRGRHPQRILEAAGRVVIERGAAGLTLEAVAATAGLSKGGLLYHYATKEALLTAMVERLVAVTEQRIAAHRAEDDAPGSWTRGYVRACAVDDVPAHDPAGRLGVALLAAGAINPGLTAGLRARQSTWRARLRDDGIDPLAAQLARLAADGLWLNDIFGLPVLARSERAAVLERLEALTRP
ncbi:MAG: TetR/AcrR family transcriptional regulator [Halofilum sp. (in: g-proteobacteria)]|nr:TetR/AcrR family transcriptional regulator [Halofilum sp. (in: g-proteobacteria)]